MTREDEELEGRPLPVQRSDGQGPMRVFCPRSRRLIPFADCIGCAHCTGIVLDVTDRGSVVRCTAEGPVDEAAPVRVPSAPAWDALERAKVRDVVTRSAPTETLVDVAPVLLDADAPLLVACHLLARAGSDRATVRAASGEVIGVLTALDVVAFLADAAGLEG